MERYKLYGLITILIHFAALLVGLAAIWPYSPTHAAIYGGAGTHDGKGTHKGHPYGSCLTLLRHESGKFDREKGFFGGVIL